MLDTIDLHGKSIFEAKKDLDIFLDRAMYEKISPVKVITGWGQGKLYSELRDFLSSHYAVSEVRKPISSGEAAFLVDIDY